MNPNYTQTITVYNRIKAPDTADKKEVWRSTILENCFWKTLINTGFNETKISTQNSYVARIPEDSRYLPYAEYVKAPEGHFTISEGDILIRGKCTETIEKIAGQTATELMQRHKPEAFKVTAFSDNTGHAVASSRHYRVGG
ncbi:MAG: hypothetical protein Q4B26_18925 [Eubacteriales bacterium]|nr:hypothetical protein [Eubacteriales bacterium]